MKLQKTVFSLTVLSDRDISGPVELLSLTELDYETMHGSSSGNFECLSVEFLSQEQMADELMKQGSDPEFLLEEGTYI